MMMMMESPIISRRPLPAEVMMAGRCPPPSPSSRVSAALAAFENTIRKNKTVAAAGLDSSSSGTFLSSLASRRRTSTEQSDVVGGGVVRGRAGRAMRRNSIASCSPSCSLQTQQQPSVTAAAAANTGQEHQAVHEATTAAAAADSCSPRPYASSLHMKRMRRHSMGSSYAAVSAASLFRSTKVAAAGANAPTSPGGHSHHHNHPDGGGAKKVLLCHSPSATIETCSSSTDGSASTANTIITSVFSSEVSPLLKKQSNNAAVYMGTRSGAVRCGLSPRPLNSGLGRGASPIITQSPKATTTTSPIQKCENHHLSQNNNNKPDPPGKLPTRLKQSSPSPSPPSPARRPSPRPRSSSPRTPMFPSALPIFQPNEKEEDENKERKKPLPKPKQSPSPAGRPAPSQRSSPSPRTPMFPSALPIFQPNEQEEDENKEERKKPSKLKQSPSPPGRPAPSQRSPSPRTPMFPSALPIFQPNEKEQEEKEERGNEQKSPSKLKQSPSRRSSPSPSRPSSPSTPKFPSALPIFQLNDKEEEEKEERENDHERNLLHTSIPDINCLPQSSSFGGQPDVSNNNNSNSNNNGSLSEIMPLIEIDDDDDDDDDDGNVHQQEQTAFQRAESAPNFNKKSHQQQDDVKRSNHEHRVEEQPRSTIRLGLRARAWGMTKTASQRKLLSGGMLLKVSNEHDASTRAKKKCTTTSGRTVTTPPPLVSPPVSPTKSNLKSLQLDDNDDNDEILKAVVSTSNVPPIKCIPSTEKNNKLFYRSSSVEMAPTSPKPTPATNNKRGTYYSRAASFSPTPSTPKKQTISSGSFKSPLCVPPASPSCFKSPTISTGQHRPAPSPRCFKSPTTTGQLRNGFHHSESGRLLATPDSAKARREAPVSPLELNMKRLQIKAKGMSKKRQQQHCDNKGQDKIMTPLSSLPQLRATMQRSSSSEIRLMSPRKPPMSPTKKKVEGGAKLFSPPKQQQQQRRPSMQRASSLPLSPKQQKQQQPPASPKPPKSPNKKMVAGDSSKIFLSAQQRPVMQRASTSSAAVLQSSSSSPKIPISPQPPPASPTKSMVADRAKIFSQQRPTMQRASSLPLSPKQQKQQQPPASPKPPTWPNKKMVAGDSAMLSTAQRPAMQRASSSSAAGLQTSSSPKTPISPRPPASPTKPMVAGCAKIFSPQRPAMERASSSAGELQSPRPAAPPIKKVVAGGAEIFSPERPSMQRASSAGGLHSPMSLRKALNANLASPRRAVSICMSPNKPMSPPKIPMSPRKSLDPKLLSRFEAATKPPKIRLRTKVILIPEPSAIRLTRRVSMPTYLYTNTPQKRPVIERRLSMSDFSGTKLKPSFVTANQAIHGAIQRIAAIKIQACMRAYAHRCHYKISLLQRRFAVSTKKQLVEVGEIQLQLRMNMQHFQEKKERHEQERAMNAINAQKFIDYLKRENESIRIQNDKIQCLTNHMSKLNGKIEHVTELHNKNFHTMLNASEKMRLKGKKIEDKCARYKTRLDKQTANLCATRAHIMSETRQRKVLETAIVRLVEEMEERCKDEKLVKLVRLMSDGDYDESNEPETAPAAEDQKSVAPGMNLECSSGDEKIPEEALAAMEASAVGGDNNEQCEGFMLAFCIRDDASEISDVSSFPDGDDIEDTSVCSYEEVLADEALEAGMKWASKVELDIGLLAITTTTGRHQGEECRTVAHSIFDEYTVHEECTVDGGCTVARTIFDEYTVHETVVDDDDDNDDLLSCQSSVWVPDTRSVLL